MNFFYHPFVERRDGILKRRSLVAVHGLNGHRDKTWTADNGCYWLKDLLQESLPNIRVLTWGYDADTHGARTLSQAFLHDHGQALVHDLVMQRKGHQVRGPH